MDNREAKTPAVKSVQPARLTHTLETASEAGADFAIIDTSPHSENSALIAARAADLVLIPIRPGFFDLRAFESTINLIRLAKTPAVVVLSAVKSRGKTAGQATKWVAKFKIPVANVHIGDRIAFSHAVTAGKGAIEYEPNGKAAKEIRQLYKYVSKQVGL